MASPMAGFLTAQVTGPSRDSSGMWRGLDLANDQFLSDFQFSGMEN